MAKNNAGTLIAVGVGGLLLYMLVKNGAFAAKPSGAQTAGTPVPGVPTNPFRIPAFLTGLQLPTQSGTSGATNVFPANSDPGEEDLNFILNVPQPNNGFGFSVNEVDSGSYT